MVDNTLVKENKKEFYNELLKVAIPVIAQQLIMVVLNLADTLMVGNISEYALAAVGAANQVYFVVIDCIFGFLSGAAVFAVQYWGIKDLKTLRKVLGIAYLMVTCFAIPMVLLAFGLAPKLIGIFATDPEVIAMGVDYMRIACFTYLIAGITFTVSYNSRAVMMLKWPTIFNAIAVGINIFLNYCLINGNFGFPRLEVRGAAIATLIARSIECILIISYIYIKKDHPLHASLSDMKFDKTLYKRVMKTAFPVVINEALWVLSFTLTFAIYGKISAIALAVVQVAMTISDIFQAIYCGLSNGCAVVIGKTLGRGERNLAYSYAKRSIKIAWVMNVITTILLILVRTPITNIYSFEPETTALLLRTLVVFALAITPKMLVFVLICGILRPGGDTMWCVFTDVGINWIIQLPLAWLSVVTFNLSLEWCVAIVALADVIKTIVCYIRFHSKKWINVFTGR